MAELRERVVNRERLLTILVTSLVDLMSSKVSSKRFSSMLLDMNHWRHSGLEMTKAASRSSYKVFVLEAI